MASVDRAGEVYLVNANIPEYLKPTASTTAETPRN